MKRKLCSREVQKEVACSRKSFMSTPNFGFKHNRLLVTFLASPSQGSVTRQRPLIIGVLNDSSSTTATAHCNHDGSNMKILDRVILFSRHSLAIYKVLLRIRLGKERVACAAGWSCQHGHQPTFLHHNCVHGSKRARLYGANLRSTHHGHKSV